MTQLDRLEALAETAWEGYRLPDLIRVARAAMHIAWSETDGPCWCQESPELTKTHTSGCLALKDALAPLYREVES